MLNIGVIGVGYLGQHHARIFSAFENVRLAAIVDTDKKRADDIAAKYDSTPYRDFREIFEKVDAISIVTPTKTHFETALECINAGKDLFIEKPITSTPEEAERLIEEAEKRGIKMQVGHIERFNPAVLRVYSLIENPVFFEAERLSPFLGRGTDADITIDLMIHDIDIILSILSRNGNTAAVKDVRAVGAKIVTNKLDLSKAWISFEDNIQAMLTSSRVASEKSRILKILQKDSYIILDYQNMNIERFFKENGEIKRETIQEEKKEPLKEELKDFVDCIITRRKPTVTAIDGLNALKVAFKIIKEGIMA